MKPILFSLLLFCTISLSAQQVTPYQPLPGAVSADDHVRFSWKKRPDVSQYTLQVSTDNVFTAPQEFITADPYWTVTGLTSPAQYWWRVKGDNGPWTTVRTFRVTDLHNWANLLLWFRADSGVTSTNNLVSQWQSLAGTGLPATQASTALQPEYVPRSYNNLPAIHFGKTGAAGEMTYLNIAPQTCTGGVFTMLSVWDVMNNTVVLQYPMGGTTQGIFAGGQAAGLTNTGSFDGVRNLQATGAVNLLLNQTSLKRNAAWRNGTTMATSGTAITSLTVSALGTRPDLPATLFFNAYLPEIMLFQTNLSDSLRLIGEAYLMSKYARPVKLPYDTNVCAPSLTLTLPGGTDEYSAILWSTGATTPTVTLGANGTFWVRATTRLGSYVTADTIRVRGIFPSPHVTPATHQYFCFNRDTIVFHKASNAAGVIYTWFNGSTDDSVRVTSGSQVYLTAYDPLSGCLIPSDTVLVTHKVKADFANTPACPGVDAFLQDLSQDLAGDTVNAWSWNFGDPSTVSDVSTDSNGVWNYAQSGTYPVYLKSTSSDGCSDSIVKNLTVKPTATPNFTWQGPCYGKPTQFFDQSVPENGTQVTGYQWTFGPGITSSFVNPAVVFDTADTYPVSLKIFTASGCNETVLLQIPVNKGVNAAFDLADSLCAKQNINELDQSQGVNDAVTGWVWHFGSNTAVSGQAPTFAFQGTGNRIVRLTATTSAGCADSVQKTVFVRPSPTAAFLFNVNGGNPPFTPTVTNQSIDADHVTWNFGSGFSDTAYTPVLPAYADTGTYAVLLAVRNNEGCTDTVTNSFVVFTGDRTLQLLHATCVPDGGFMTYTARVFNKGALEVNEITFEASTDYNSIIQENWTGSLLPGQVLEYPLKASAKYYTSADFCCVRIEHFNDTLHVQPPDDKICLPLSTAPWFSAAYPTPSDGVISIDRVLPFADKLSATLYTVDGKTVRVLFSNIQASAGFSSMTTDITDVRAGLYIIRFSYRDKYYSVKVVKR